MYSDRKLVAEEYKILGKETIYTAVFTSQNYALRALKSIRASETY